jgi:hypothetical protein
LSVAIHKKESPSINQNSSQTESRPNSHTGIPLEIPLDGMGCCSVDLGLGKSLDNLCAVLETVGNRGTAQRLAALNDAGITSQARVGYTVESAVA